MEWDANSQETGLATLSTYLVFGPKFEFRPGQPGNHSRHLGAQGNERHGRDGARSCAMIRKRLLESPMIVYASCILTPFKLQYLLARR
jgi:hypothetical protein